MQGDTIRVTLLVTGELEKLNVPYAVCGSVSSSLYGVMRSTLDVDIVADMRPEHIQPFVAVLSKEFYADEEKMRDALEYHSSFHLIHYETSFKVDIFIPKRRPFDRMEMERRDQSVITTEPEQRIFITSPEDVILSKLEWYRMGGEASDQHWHDILGVLKTKSGELDLVYLRRWAAELNVADLLEQALQEE